MITLACQFHAADQVHFTAFDRFEDRPADRGPGMSLRDAHRTLKASGARIQLVPGGPCEGLARAANAMGKLDLLLLAPGPDAQDLAAAWFYVPRLLHGQSLVFSRPRRQTVRRSSAWSSTTKSVTWPTAYGTQA